MHSCRVKDLDAAAEKACGFCDDFTSRFADVSVGSVGSKEGYSTVIVRSEMGEKLVQKLDAEKGAVDKARSRPFSQIQAGTRQKKLHRPQKANVKHAFSCFAIACTQTVEPSYCLCKRFFNPNPSPFKLEMNLHENTKRICANT